MYFGYCLLSRYMVCKYFLPSVGCLFTFLIVSRAVQKRFSLSQSHLSLLLLPVLLASYLRRPCSDHCQEAFSLCCLLGFTVSGLTFKSSIHFELIFVCGVRKGLNFSVLHVNIQFSQHQLLKRLSFLYCFLSIFTWVCFWAVYCSVGLFVYSFVSIILF